MNPEFTADELRAMMAALAGNDPAPVGFTADEMARLVIDARRAACPRCGEAL